MYSHLTEVVIVMNPKFCGANIPIFKKNNTHVHVYNVYIVSDLSMCLKL